MSTELFFKKISDGLIDGEIYFKIFGYVYTVHKVNPHNTTYNPPSIEQSDAEGFCSISYYEEEEVILVCIDNMSFYWNEFPSRFSSKIDLKECRVDGEKNEDIRTVVIPFKDMCDKPTDNYRMELMFERNKLFSIIFVISKLDDNFQGTMENLQLLGELCGNKE
jgi:hypothetical protein